MNENISLLSSKQRKERMQQSKNFRNGKFHNLNLTPALTEGYGYFKVLYEFFFKKVGDRRPLRPIPSIKTKLSGLNSSEDILVWFGHSSYFMQIDGKKFLIDPVFSGNASPLRGSNTSFNGSDIYTVQDLPSVDYLIITHDHYDHADYPTLVQLPSKTGRVICGLGVGRYLEKWGFSPAQILERDWDEKVVLTEGFQAYIKPARHFSGRGMIRNNTLWMSVLLQTPTMKIYIGGDSGYDTHFAEIGREFGEIDLAILENGQYDVKWKYIHMQPDEVLKAGMDLNAKRILPVHSAKFAMANHAWNEPLKRITALNEDAALKLITPMIGEVVRLKDPNQQFKDWWIPE
jgi:L-ascorbate metabolism protein UlaG (beta-lactamase superfamily)